MTGTLRRTRTLRRTVPLRRGALVRAGALALAAALTLGACATGDAEPAAGSPSESATTSPSATGDGDATTDGDAMADGPLSFTAATVAGGEIDVATLAGEPVVLWFWAPWCTICRGEAPDVSEVVAELGDEVTFLGVAGRGEVDAMQGFVSDTEVTGFEHLNDVDGSIWARFGVATQPSFAFVSPDGTVETVAGALGADGLRDRASALLDG